MAWVVRRCLLWLFGIDPPSQHPHPHQSKKFMPLLSTNQDAYHLLRQRPLGDWSKNI